MAVTGVAGFETQSIGTEPGVISTVGAAAISTVQARTGVASIRCNPASGADGWFSLSSNTGWIHFGLYVAALPSLKRNIAAGLGLNADGTLVVTGAGTSALALATGRWYWIGYRVAAGSGVDLLQIDGVTQVTGTAVGSSTNLGPDTAEASAVDLYFDDIIVDGAGFLAPSKVDLLVPTADSAVGTGWTLGSGLGISGNGWDSVNNKPPLGAADNTGPAAAGEIRNAASAANSNYDATMTTYAALGISSYDVVLAVQPIVATAAPVSTSAKQGTVGVVSNPTITNVALGTGGTAGAFWSGSAGGAYPTGWKVSTGTLTTSPTITPATAPVMRITQVTSSTRIVDVCFMGIHVAWTPGARNPIRKVSQAINRASGY